jgi:multiple sugar transport system ATP-binding protein
MEAMAMADKIAVMNHGIIEQYGTPQQIYARPASMYVAEFIGAPPMNFIRFRGRAASGAETVRLGGREIRVPRLHEDTGDTELALGIRPEHIRFADAGELAGAVYAVEYLGSTQIVTVETADGRLKARVPAAQRLRPGETVALALDSDRLSLFDAASGRAIASALGAAHG